LYNENRFVFYLLLPQHTLMFKIEKDYQS